MARKGNPISVRLDLNRSSDSSWFHFSTFFARLLIRLIRRFCILYLWNLLWDWKGAALLLVLPDEWIQWAISVIGKVAHYVGEASGSSAGPSRAESANADSYGQPAPPEIPYTDLLQQEGRRGKRLRELHALVSDQFRSHCERGLPGRGRLPNSRCREDALRIMGEELEIGPDMLRAEIEEWITAINENPDLLREIYNRYGGRRRS